MFSKRSSEGTLLWRAFALILIVSVLLFSLPGLAAASTPSLNQATSQVQALKDLLAQLDDQMSAASENYDYANQQLANTQAAATKTAKELTQGESALAAARTQFDQRVVDIYKNGDVPVLSVLMNSSSFSDLVTRLEQLSRISDQDARLVSQVQAYTKQVAENKTKLDAERKQQTTYVAQTAAAKQKVLDQLTKQNQALKGKEAQVAELRQQEAAQQAALVAAAQKSAEQAAAQEAAVQAASAKAKTVTTTASGARTTTTAARGGKGTTITPRRTTTTTSAHKTTTTTTGGGGGTGSGGVTGAAIVSYALKFVGVPYVWGGSSPSGFDCSGFTMYVYRHFGISLPHSSAMDYNYGTPVAQSQLKPGDLVFFYSPIHHVGIAIGNGNMIDCRTGGVQVESVYWSSYTGARRILN
jgi:cell wall-associated NlpC family hydrolase